MAVNDFVRRSMQIVAGGIVESTTSYFDNVVSFTNDVKEVIDMGKQMGSDSAKKFSELKNSGIMKKARDWFYNEGGMFGDFDFDDDDFDPGFEIDSADSENGSDSSKPLSKDMMTDIAKKQTGAMYTALGHHADLQIANTAEIVSTLNTRSAELTASVNNVNNTLIQIGKRLDLIVEWTSARTKHEEEEKRKASILDYDGGISLTGIVNKAKENAEDSIFGTVLSMGKTMLSSSMMTPENVMSLLLSQTILDKGWDKLGGKSINDIGDFINDTIGEVIQNTMTKVLTTENDMLKTLFEDIISGSGGNKNYQSSVKNTYDDKPAVFDGMTRKSIISIIPGYLNEILKAVSPDGSGRSIDDKGNLKKYQSDTFVKTVADSYFRAGTMEYDQRKYIVEHSELVDKEVTNAMRTLTGCWVWYLYQSNRKLLRKGEVKDITQKSTRYVVDYASYMMAKADPKHRSQEEWKILYQGIIDQIDDYKYRIELQKSAERADQDLEKFARTDPNNHLARKVSQNVIMEAFRTNYKVFNKDAKFNDDDVAPSQIGTQSTTPRITELDYMAGIFDVLNRGINVTFARRTDPFELIQMVPGYATRNIAPITTSVAIPVVTTTTETIPIPRSVETPISSLEGSIMSTEDEKKRRMDPDTLEAYEKQKRGETLSKREEKLLRKFNRSESVVGKAWSLITGKNNDSRKEYFIPPEMQELMKFTDDIKKTVIDRIPDPVKDKYNEFMETKTGKKIAKARDAVEDKLVSGMDKATDFLFGRRIDPEGYKADKEKSKTSKKADDSGEEHSEPVSTKPVREGGFLHTITKPINSLIKRGSDAYAHFMTTEQLKENAGNIFSQYKTGGSYAPGGEHFSSDNTDLVQVQAVESSVSVAMSNGEVSTDDIRTTTELMNGIKDPKTRGSLKRYLIPLMKRNSKSKTKSSLGDDSDEKSTLGKIGSMLFKSGKLAFFGIYFYLKKIIIPSVTSLIKTGLKTIFNFAKWGLTRSFRQFKYGAKSLFEGIKQVSETVMKKPIDFITDKLYETFEDLKSKIGTIFGKAFSGISEKVSNILEKSAEKRAKNVEEKNTLKDKVGRLGDRLSDAKSNVINAIGGNKDGFMGGFFQARNERKEAEAKARLEDQVKPITKAMEESGITDIKTAADEVADVLKDESESGKGFMKPVIKLLNKLVKNNGAETEIPETAATPETKTPEQKKSKPQMDSIDSPQMEEIGNIRSTDLGGNKPVKTDTSKTGKSDGKSGGFLNGIGKMIGGMSDITKAILNAIMTIVLSLDGAKAIFNAAMKIVIESIQPLNKVFQSLFKTLKPLMKELGSIIKQLSEYIVVIVDTVMDIIKPVLQDVVQPILETISPLLESILGVVTPILKLLGMGLKLIFAPLFGIIKFVIVPVIKIISDSLQINMGVLQVGLGGLMMGIGGVIAGIGGLISIVGNIFSSSVKNLGESVLDTGTSMMKQGGEFVVQGGKSVVQGAGNLALDLANTLSLGATDEAAGRNEEQPRQIKTIEPGDSDTVERTYANGDVTNIYNTYAGEYQRSMGGYLNMNQRGCGPIALADMYNRGMGGSISARSLAGSMYSSGRYNPHRGTSVADYIDTGRSMGMNLRSGKVTQRSLKSASPTNPITVVGSGPDYGTRKGNNHFMNVIGTDSHGMAFVSNPLTGRIDRKSTSTVVGSSIMGIYGSGDEQDGGYTFPDAIKEAFKKLKNEAAKILGLFSMEQSDEDAINESIDTEKNLYATEQAKRQLGETEYAKIEEIAKANARADYEKTYPKRDGQSDEEYERKFEEYWNSKSTQYLADAELYSKASENGKNAWATFATTSDKLIDDYVGTADENGNRSGGLFDSLGKAYTDINENIKNISSSSGSSGSGGSGYFTSDEGVPLWVPYSDNIQITETDITKGNSNSPLFEFFAKTMGYNLGDVYGSGWFTHYNNPNKEGVGSAGDRHSGVDFTAGGISGKPLYATTGGKVVSKSYQADGGGNMLIWQDSAGKYHWYMHMAQPSLLNVGDTIEGGDLIGYAGTTGASTGPHLHYTINDSLVSSGSGNVLNPLMYFKNYNPTGGTLVGGTNEEKIWAYLTSHGFEKHAAAGVMGAFQVESSNDPDTLEGYYAFDDGSRHNPTVEAALKSYDSLDNYVTTKLFPYYDSSGLSINKPGYRGTDGHYYPGLGLAQWTGPRTKSLGEYTVGKGLQWNDLTGQLDYLKHELDINSRYNAAVRSMNNSNDVNTATSIWLSEFEGNPGDKLAERQKYANDFYLRYKNWTPETPETFTVNGSGSTSTGFGLVNSASDARRQDNYNQIKSADGKNTGIVNTESGDLNMRSDKSIDSSVLITIPKGTRLNLEASGSPGWYNTTFGGKTGYVSSAYILLDNDDANNFSYSATTESPTGPYQLEDMINNNSSKSSKSSSSTQYPQQVSIPKTTKTTNIDHSDDAQWYQVNGKWVKDNKVFAANDPRWRSAWYNESTPRHYSEFSPAFSSLEHMVTVATNPSLRNGEYYNNLVDEYGGGQSGRYSVQSMYDDLADSEGWKASRDDYIKKSKANRRSSAFLQDLQALHNAYWPSKKLSVSEMETRVKGSGDADTILAEDQFWNDYLGWNNRYSSNVTRGLSDGSDTAYSSDTYYDTEAGTTVVNNYSVTRAEDKATDARIKAILANTYNVRSESMEALLEAILEELRKRRESKGEGNNTNGSQKLFDERIPTQVTKLSIG